MTFKTESLIGHLLVIQIGLATVIWIALSIILQSKSSLLFTSIGFIFYFTIILFFLSRILRHALFLINLTIEKPSREKDRKILIESSLTTSDLSIWILTFLFIPIPWILSTEVDQEILKTNLVMPNTLILFFIIIILLAFLSKIYSGVIPETKEEVKTQKHLIEDALIKTTIFSLTVIIALPSQLVLSFSWVNLLVNILSVVVLLILPIITYYALKVGFISAEYIERFYKKLKG